MRLVQETTARVATERARAIAARPPPLADSSFVSGGWAATGGRDDSGASLTGTMVPDVAGVASAVRTNDRQRTDPPLTFS